MTAETDPNGKVPMWTGLFLKFPNALEAVAKLSGQNETEKGDKWKIDGAEYRTNSMLRHLKSEAVGEAYDPDGLLHAGQVAWNALARLELILQDNFPAIANHVTDTEFFWNSSTNDRRKGPRRWDRSIAGKPLPGRRSTD